MKSEIGSEFWLSPYNTYDNGQIGNPEQFNCNGNDYVWLSTGRSAIKFVLRTIEKRNPGIKKIAVLPSFTCNTVIQPFVDEGYRIEYYPIDHNLRTSCDAIFQKVREVDATVVLFHRYFGFDTLDNYVDELCGVLRDLGKFTIEDCTQCLYSDISRADADFFVGSLRKWMGMPDGAFAVCRNDFFDEKPTTSDEVLEKAKMRAYHSKYLYLFENIGIKEEMLSMCREAELILDNQTEMLGISPISAEIQAKLDRRLLAEKRKDNFLFLEKSLKGDLQPLFFLSSCNVPLYFPVMVEERELFQRYLIQNAVYAPVVWPKNLFQQQICDGAKCLYEHMLCIPIDQRYDAEDMERIVDVCDKFIIDEKNSSTWS